MENSWENHSGTQTFELRGTSDAWPQEESQRQTKDKYRALSRGAVALIMLDTFRRIFSEARPIDILMLVVELLVLLLIAVEVLPSIMHSFIQRRRRKKLFSLMSMAETLFRTVPRPTDDRTVQETWVREARQWMEEATSFFRTYPKYTYEFFERNEGVDISVDPMNPQWRDTETGSVVRTFGYRKQNMDRILGDRNLFLDRAS